ncbi:MAG: Uma2 family endonuclease [Anaerolineae bacterium]|nr:Uma2 family endonuclease [Anaerolineae bacterium]
MPTGWVLFLGMYLLQHNTGGVTTGADGGYEIPGERYIPDVAYVSAARQSEPSENAYGPIPPDLAVEVLSPSNTAHEMRIKIVNYLSVNTTVWVVDPDRRVVEVYVPGQPVRTLAANATLDGGDLLPGFALAVGDIFQTGHDQRGV